MTTLSVLVIALVLAPGLQSAVVQTRDLPSISNYPLFIDEQQDVEQIQHLPGKIELSPEIKPLPLPVDEEENVVVPELRPLPIPEDPCAACFSYMSSLIDQLTESVAEPSLPGIESLPLPEAPEPPKFVIHPAPMFAV